MRRGRVFIYLALILILGLAAVAVVWQRFLQPAPAPVTSVTPVAPVDTVSVVVVTQKIQRGDILKEEVLKLSTLPREMFIQGMFENVNDAIGRQAKYDLDAGIPLTAGMLVSSSEQLAKGGSTAALSIPRGMVAVSVPINTLSSVSYAPQPGDHVNVIVTMLFADLDTEFQTLLPNKTMGVIGTGAAKGGGTSSDTASKAGTGGVADPGKNEGSADLQVESSSLTAMVGGGGASKGRAEVDAVFGQTFYMVPSEAQRPRMTSQTLLQDIVVLNVGNFLKSSTQEGATSPQAQATPSADGGAAEQPQPTTPKTTSGAAKVEVKPPDVITLIVSPQDAITLNYLMYYFEKGAAQITLALRSAGDESRVETQAVTLQFLLDQYQIPVPVKLPYGVKPRVEELTLPSVQSEIQPTPKP